MDLNAKASLQMNICLADVIAFDEEERSLIGKQSSFYGLCIVVNLALPENFSGANDVISMPCASVSLFGVISLDKIVLRYGLLSLLFGGFSSKVEEFQSATERRKRSGNRVTRFVVL